MFSLICVSTNGWVDNREAGDLRRHRAHYDAIVMIKKKAGLLWIYTDVRLGVYLCILSINLMHIYIG